MVPSLAAGLLVAASVPPWGFWILAVPGFAVLAWRLEGLAGAARTAAGLAFGLGLFVPTLFWMTEFHAIGFVGAALLEASFMVLMCVAVPPRRAALALPAAFVLAEAARGSWPFGGLPLGGPALGQAGGPLAPSAALGGALLAAGLAAAAGCALVAAARRRFAVAGALAAAVVALPLLGIAVAPSPSSGSRLRAALVQGGGERGLRAVYGDPTTVFERHLAQSDAIRGPVDLVLWPENTVDVPALDGSPEESDLAATAQRLDASLVAGVTEDASADRFENVAVAWTPTGAIGDQYAKVHRVPFGEYVPGRALIAKIADLTVLPRDAVAGRGSGAIQTAAGRFGVSISYEVFFADRARSAIRDGGRLLLVPTNAASFKTSQVPTQEVAAARLRAWETGRWVLQAAPTGYSAVIDPRGHVLARSRLGAAQTLYADARLLSGTTPYLRFGDGPLLAVAFLVLLGAQLLSRRDDARTASPPPVS